MRRVFAPALLALALLGGVAGAATNPDEISKDPVIEQRARALSKELRCLVCQNQSIDDSDAELARDLRKLVRERLVAGDSDAEVIQFLTERYGDFVLLRPPVRPATWGLWFGPAVLLLVAGGGLAWFLRRRDPGPPPAELDPEEQARLDALLAGEAPAKR
jgi:cytochrome c-type biogenesis protein CcmH